MRDRCPPTEGHLEALHPEARSQVRQGAAADKLAPAFTADTAAKTGRSERDVQRDAARGAIVADGTEIAENLHRAELSAVERAEHIAEWVRITSDKGAQSAPPCGGAQPHDKGIKAAVRDLGLERTLVQRSVKIDVIAPA